MITTERHAIRVRTEIEEIKQLLRAAAPADADVLRMALDELNSELSEYESITSGRLSRFAVHSLAELPDALIKARLHRGWTQGQLAKALGVSEQMVQKDESGGYDRASLARLASVAAILEVDLTGEVRFVDYSNPSATDEDDASMADTSIESAGACIELDELEEKVQSVLAEPRALGAGSALLFTFEPAIPINIVVSLLNEEASVRPAVAIEDFHAFETVARMVPRGRATGHIVDLVTDSDVPIPTPDNLILLCGKRRNKVTSAVLEHAATKEHVGIDFVPTADGPFEGEWAMVIGDELYISPNYDQEREYKADPKGYEGPFEDYGIVTKFPNPWNPEARVLLVAGIRALGTWGAGLYLSEHAEAIGADVGPANFVAVIKATRESARKRHIVTETLEFKTL